MFKEWTQRVGSMVPRGFSRYYILQQLMENPHTGKEIIDSAVEAFKIADDRKSGSIKVVLDINI